MADNITHKGTLFWLAYPGNFDNDDNGQIVIMADMANTDFEVAIPGLAFNVAGTASPGSPGLVTIPSQAAIRSNEVIEDKGIRVTASHPVTVVFYSPELPTTSTEAYLALPVAALASLPLTAHQPLATLAYREDISDRGVDPDLAPSQMTIVATEDGTSITVIPSCVSLSGSQTGEPIHITLNQGQTWQYACGHKGDTTGTIVTANKPIAIYGGNRCADIPPTIMSCDYLAEQLIPTSLLGIDYLIPPLQNGTANLVRVLAIKDNTIVRLDDGIDPMIVTLNAGEVFDSIYSLPVHVTSNRRIYVGQYGSGGLNPPPNNDRDPFFMQIIPTNRFLTEHRFFSIPEYSMNYINIVAPPGTNVALDGAPVDGFAAMPNSNHMWVALEVGPGEHTVTADAPVMVYMYGFNFATGYGYPAGLLVRRARRPSRGFDLL